MPSDRVKCLTVDTALLANLLRMQGITVVIQSSIPPDAVFEGAMSYRDKTFLVFSHPSWVEIPTEYRDPGIMPELSPVTFHTVVLSPEVTSVKVLLGDPPIFQIEGRDG